MSILKMDILAIVLTEAHVIRSGLKMFSMCCHHLIYGYSGPWGYHFEYFGDPGC